MIPGQMFEQTSGVVPATMAASSTSSLDCPAGNACRSTWTSGFAAFQAVTSSWARARSWGFGALQ